MKCPTLSLLRTKWTSVRESWVIAARDLGLEGSATCQTKGLCASRNLLSQRRYSTDTAPKRPFCVIGREAFERKNKSARDFLLFLLSLLFLRHKIKDGGYSNTNTYNKLSPAQNTPALQASGCLSGYETKVAGWLIRGKRLVGNLSEAEWIKVVDFKCQCCWEWLYDYFMHDSAFFSEYNERISWPQKNDEM